MRRTTAGWKTMGVLGLDLAAGIAAGIVPCHAAPAQQKLVFNGRVASTDVRTINGRAFVSIRDMAEALGMVVVAVPGGYEIKKAGGTSQVGDLDGKVGDVLFDGQWRLQVMEVQLPPTFQTRTQTLPYAEDTVATYDTETRTFRPKEGHKLVVIKVRVTNGQKAKHALWFSIPDEQLDTALTDLNGRSFPPIAYDTEGAPFETQQMLPGAALTFPIIFSVPEDVRLKDLIFTLKNSGSQEKGHDARVALTQRGATAPAAPPAGGAQ